MTIRESGGSRVSALAFVFLDEAHHVEAGVDMDQLAEGGCAELFAMQRAALGR